MEEKRPQEPTPQSKTIERINRLFLSIDDVILLFVIVGIVILAVKVLKDAFRDLLGLEAHAVTVAHTISDLMFVLIIMELSRQVIRHLRREPFSLNPFLFIGVIASIRGILLVQMGLALGEMEWEKGVMQLVVYATIVLILVLCYYLTTKTEKIPKAPS